MRLLRRTRSSRRDYQAQYAESIRIPRLWAGRETHRLDAAPTPSNVSFIPRISASAVRCRRINFSSIARRTARSTQQTRCSSRATIRPFSRRVSIAALRRGPLRQCASQLGVKMVTASPFTSRCPRAASRCSPAPHRRIHSVVFGVFPPDRFAADRDLRRHDRDHG